MRRLLGIFGAGVGGAVLGVLLVTVAQTPPSGDRLDSAPTTTIPAKVAPLPEPRADVLLAWTPGRLAPALAPTARSLADVDVVSEVAAGLTNLVASRDSDGHQVDRTEPGWSIPLDAIAIDPAAQAELASLADREAVASLRPGQALLSRASAELRRLDVGGTIELDSGHELVVGGIVEDATIGAAELAVDQATGRRIGVATPRYLLVAHGGDRAAVEASLRQALPPDAPVRFRGLGETPYLRHADAVLPHLRVKQRFGEFAYKPPVPGRREFVQDPVWQSENLVTRDLPVIGTARCHRAIIEAVEGALAEIEDAGLAPLIDPDGFAGCWNPRLVVPGGDLSHHAWGAALDLNYGANPTGRESIQDPRLIEIFERWGFTSGSEWLVPDPAHFEFVRPPQP